MLIKLPNGDVVDSSDIASVKAKEAHFVPDRVEVEFADGEKLVLVVPDIVDAEDLRDRIVDGIDVAGECVLDLMDDFDDPLPPKNEAASEPAPEAPGDEAATIPLPDAPVDKMICPNCHQPIYCLAKTSITSLTCPNCGATIYNPDSLPRVDPQIRPRPEAGETMVVGCGNPRCPECRGRKYLVTKLA